MGRAGSEWVGGGAYREHLGWGVGEGDVPVFYYIRPPRHSLLSLIHRNNPTDQAQGVIYLHNLPLLICTLVTAVHFIGVTCTG